MFLLRLIMLNLRDLSKSNKNCQPQQQQQQQEELTSKKASGLTFYPILENIHKHMLM